MKRALHTFRRAVAIAVFIHAAGTCAMGQTPAGATAVLTASGGFGSMAPLYGDDDREGVPVFGSLARRLGGASWLEGEVTRRTYTRISDMRDVILPITVTPIAGTTGHADRLLSTHSTTDWTAGVNLVGRTRGRVAFFGGGGLMLHHQQLTYTIELTNCTPPSASPSGTGCQPYNLRDSKFDVGAQGFAGGEAYVAPRMRAFAAVRYEMRPDLGFGTFGFVAGARITILTRDAGKE